jgi:uncharacterized protein with GYD domain
MDTAEFFTVVVKGNYDEFDRKPDDFRLLWNAIVSMNTLPEYVALGQLGYDAAATRRELEKRAEQIRNQRGLLELKVCADALKHVRKIKKQNSEFRTVATSTGVSPNDATSWTTGTHDPHYLVDVARRAFKTLSAWPEFR